MVYSNALNSYQKAQVSCDISPEKLIHMLYEGAIKRINLAKEGLRRDDPRQRGENIGKAIAIISELNASLDKDIQTDEINFLRSLYMTMMNELANVSVTKNMETLELAGKYLMELKRIWETTVMTVKNKTAHAPVKNVKTGGASPAYPTYGGNLTKRTSIAV